MKELIKMKLPIIFNKWLMMMNKLLMIIKK